MIAKAAIGDGNGQFSIEEIQVSPPQKDEVLIEIKAAGICHTDWDSLSWGKTLILGHEGSGIVQAIGPNVKSLKVGDSVVLNWAIPCYNCFQCHAGNEHICEKNSPVTAGNKISGGHANYKSTTYKGQAIERSFSLGTLSSHTLVREAACVKIHVDIPWASSSILSCGVMTGYGSVMNAAKVVENSIVVVLGTGGVGLNVIQAARIAKASKIIAIDINLNRLAMAMEYGATKTILAESTDHGLLDAAQKVKTITGGRGADYAFECTAIPTLGAAPLAMIRNAGTAIQVSGIEQTIPFDMNLFEWDKIYINPLYGKCRPQIDIPILQNLYASGDLILDKMITKTYPLEQLSQAFEDMHQGKNAKGVILF